MKTLDRFLAAISYNKGQKIKYEFNSSYCIKNNDFYHCTLESLLLFVKAWLRCLEREKNIIIKDENWRIFGKILSEVIANASDHGSSHHGDDTIKLAIWTGDKGLIAGIKDQGLFFKSPKTKKQFESKIYPNDEWIQKNEQNCGLGLNDIYRADELYVDTRSGFLYMLWLFK